MGAATDTHREAQISNAKRGGRTALLSRTVTCLTLGEGWVANLMVYMIQEFHITSINSTLISNIVNGFLNLFPVLGAITADSFLVSFQVIWISSFISLLGTILLASTATFDSLRPQRCDIGLSLCKAPSKVQFAVLYSGIALACLGLANQFEIPQHQGIFFNWFFILTYASTVISSAAFVYIEDNVSWRLGFGLNIAANLAGVLVLSSRSEDYYQEQNAITSLMAATLEQKFSLCSPPPRPTWFFGANVGLMAIPATSFGWHWGSISFSGTSSTILSRISGLSTRHGNFYDHSFFRDWSLFEHSIDRYRPKGNWLRKTRRDVLDCICAFCVERYYLVCSWKYYKDSRRKCVEEREGVKSRW
ncbi:hypothetical protein CUMW_035320 [Citrus unshiu]|nr:hypothetical protein CUMW_035320 [Citrus unshiu]